MKQIQDWLGHSDMSTTANIYSHLDAVSKADTGAGCVGRWGEKSMKKRGCCTKPAPFLGAERWIRTHVRFLAN